MTRLVRIGKVTRPSITQIVSLTMLAPDIQEQPLFLPRITEGKPEISDKTLRPVALFDDRVEQRYLFGAVFGKPSSNDSDAM